MAVGYQTRQRAVRRVAPRSSPSPEDLYLAGGKAPFPSEPPSGFIGLGGRSILVPRPLAARVERFDRGPRGVQAEPRRALRARHAFSKLYEPV
jgi:hypothetical protein